MCENGRSKLPSPAEECRGGRFAEAVTNAQGTDLVEMRFVVVVQGEEPHGPVFREIPDSLRVLRIAQGFPSANSGICVVGMDRRDSDGRPDEDAHQITTAARQ